MTDQDRIAWSLFTLRIGVFIVMALWTFDKLLNPEHAAGVFEHFYFIGGLQNTAMHVIAIVELLVIIGFVLGIKKRLTYGFVFLVHAISTFSSWEFYKEPFGHPNMLFFTAFPMLAACFALYLMRDMDTKFTLGNMCCKKDEDKK